MFCHDTCVCRDNHVFVTTKMLLVAGPANDSLEWGCVSLKAMFGEGSAAFTGSMLHGFLSYGVLSSPQGDALRTFFILR